MSDALIARYEKQISDLTSENATLKSEAKDRRIKAKRLQEQLDLVEKEREALKGEFEGLKAKADAQPSELQAEVDRLQGELRSRDHRDAFKSVSEFSVPGEDGKEQSYTLNDGVTVDALWKHLDYKPEGDKPDPVKIAGLMSEAVKTASYLFKPKAAEAATSEAGASQHPIASQRREPGPGAGTRVLNPASGHPSVAALVQSDYASTGRKVPGRL